MSSTLDLRQQIWAAAYLKASQQSIFATCPIEQADAALKAFDDRFSCQYAKPNTPSPCDSCLSSEPPTKSQ